MNTAIPIQIGDVQVIDIHHDIRHLTMRIKLNCKPSEVVLISSRMEASKKLKQAFRYLVDEDFIISSPLQG